MIVLLSALAIAAADRDQTKRKAEEFPGWGKRSDQKDLPVGVYLSAITTNFSQEIVLKSDGKFASRFAGETHRKGKSPEWTEWKFSGRWVKEGGWITFFYKDEEKEHSYSFMIGLWRSKPAFIFARPDDNRCAFIAECFAFVEKEPSQETPTPAVPTACAGPN